MDSIAKWVENKLENVLESGLAKMSGMVDGLVANQKGLQMATETLTSKMETLQKLAQEIGSSAKETSAWSHHTRRPFSQQTTLHLGQVLCKCTRMQRIQG